MPRTRSLPLHTLRLVVGTIGAVAVLATTVACGSGDTSNSPEATTISGVTVVKVSDPTAFESVLTAGEEEYASTSACRLRS